MPVITIGRQFGAGGATVGHMLATELKADFLDSKIIDEVARRLQLPKAEVEAEDEQPGSLLARLLVALGSASSEPLIPPEAPAWTPPNTAPTFDTRKAVLQITQHVIEETDLDRLARGREAEMLPLPKDWATEHARRGLPNPVEAVRRAREGR